MIVVELTSGDKKSLVEFHDCEAMDDPAEVVFKDMSMWFPFDDLPNRLGQIRGDGLCSPEDFIDIAEDVGLEAMVVE